MTTAYEGFLTKQREKEQSLLDVQKLLLDSNKSTVTDSKGVVVDKDWIVRKLVNIVERAGKFNDQTRALKQLADALNINGGARATEAALIFEQIMRKIIKPTTIEVPTNIPSIKQLSAIPSNKNG